MSNSEPLRLISSNSSVSKFGKKTKRVIAAIPIIKMNNDVYLLKIFISYQITYYNKLFFKCAEY